MRIRPSDRGSRFLLAPNLLPQKGGHSEQRRVRRERTRGGKGEVALHKAVLSVLAVGVLALFAVPASASIIFLDGNHPQPGMAEENIMFESGALIPNVVQIGDTNKSNTPVIFDTDFLAPVGSAGLDGSNQGVVASGIGQANIVCVPGAGCVDNSAVLGPNGSSQLTSLEMRPGAGFGWTDVIANPDFGTGTMNVFVQDNF